jgi:ATP-binding cassette subfamily F protein uup
MLEEALAVYKGTVICVSHDRYFLDRICDQIVAFEDHGVVVQPGNYSYYLEKREAREKAQRLQMENSQKSSHSQKSKSSARKIKPLSNKERADLETIEQRIEDAENAVVIIEERLNDPAFQAENYDKLPEETAKLEEAKKVVSDLFARWEELEERVAQGT